MNKLGIREKKNLPKKDKKRKHPHMLRVTSAAKKEKKKEAECVNAFSLAHEVTNQQLQRRW